MLRALDVVGVADRERVRTAWRVVCCGTRNEEPAFDAAFAAFFGGAPTGVPQPAYAPRHTRPGNDPPPAPANGRQPPHRASDDEPDAGEGGAAERRAVDEPAGEAARWQAMRARYSPAGTGAKPPDVTLDAVLAMGLTVERFIRSIALGRSRRWAPLAGGRRFDLRRTLRASLATGGDPFTLHALGHPARNPRFVILIDGSRSIADRTGPIVAFAAALSARWSRTQTIFFSTGLRDVTTALRGAVRHAMPLPALGEAWGGGTKIGTNLAHFVDGDGGRTITRETLVIIFSDGLDVGELPQLMRAMRELDRRSAGVVWLNPHAAAADYVPAARGMKAALPYITVLSGANDAAGFGRLATQLARNPRLRGRR